MELETILEYVSKTPANSNRAVLRTMLEEFGEGGDYYTRAEVDSLLSKKQKLLKEGPGISLEDDNDYCEVSADVDVNLDLQQVTENGSTTTTDIILKDPEDPDGPNMTYLDGHVGIYHTMGDYSNSHTVRLGRGHIELNEHNDNGLNAGIHMSTHHINAHSFHNTTGESNYFSLEWSDVPGVSMSDGIREGWKSALTQNMYEWALKITLPEDTGRFIGWSAINDAIRNAKTIVAKYNNSVYFVQNHELVDDITLRFLIRDETNKFARIYLCRKTYDEPENEEYELSLYHAANLPGGLLKLNYNSSTFQEAFYAASDGTAIIIEGTTSFTAITTQSSLSNNVSFFCLDGVNNRLVKYTVTNRDVWSKETIT